ncbi:MAG TPA: hypothetical protein VKU40_06215, partial [Thermoanaerobaculia bacterium]|nr:hypothetical protein [Thermoanaerobaculia bacterium]
MKRAAFVGGAFALVLVVLVLALIQPAPEGKREPVAPPPLTSPAPPITPTEPAPPAQQGFLYGRVTATDGATYVGRLRMGGGEEAFWSDFFNGAKAGNPWAGQVAPERLTERVPVEFLGLRFGSRERPIDLDRPFMVRFGDVERIDARGRDLWVTVKSGTVFQLDRYGADDFADGVRVWDERHGVVDLRERQVRSIELFPTARLDETPGRLHGTVHTAQGVFTGPIQWNREDSVGSDELEG